MQVEICVKVDGHVLGLVRCTHLRREDGDKQFGRQVLRTVCKGAQHGSKLFLVSSHLQDEACSRSEAEGAG